MESIELVVFENVSVIHQKALSLPFGKVSLRQLLMISAGMLGAVIAYSVTGEIWYPGMVFGGFFALGMITTKVLTLDHMLKSTVSFLIKGTSLSKKPQYMIDAKRTAKKESENNANKKTTNEKPAENKNIIEQAISQIELLLGKKLKVIETQENDSKIIDEQIELETETKDDDIPKNSKEEKRYSVDVTIQPDNVLQILNLQDHYTIKKENNILEKILNLFKKNINNQNKRIPEIITVYLNGAKLAKTDYTIHKDNSVAIALNEDSKYSVTIHNENNSETVIVS